jgi:hypothetical protein
VQVCRGVSWDLLELAELEQIARCLGGAALAAICRMFVSGGVTSGGLPDLLLWRPMANSDDDAAEDTTMERESETSGQRREQAALTAGTKTAAAGESVMWPFRSLKGEPLVCERRLPKLTQ